MRREFDEQLRKMNRELKTMGALCERSIATAAKALLDGDQDQARAAIAADAQIDRQERELESLCLSLFLHQQPVARDLRQISAALKMITDMERIGDQAADIADIVCHAKIKPADTLPHIGDMARATIKMVADSITAFVTEDLEMVRAVIDYDDVVDELFDKNRKEIIDLIAQNPAEGAYALDMLMIIKYFERIGDHATNIAEWVEYSITGTHRREEEDKTVQI